MCRLRNFYSREACVWWETDSILLLYLSYCRQYFSERGRRGRLLVGDVGDTFTNSFIGNRGYRFERF